MTGDTHFADAPFSAETPALLESVRDHDFGIVDVDTSGTARPIRDRGGWEARFRELFATHTAMGVGVLEFTHTPTVAS